MSHIQYQLALAHQDDLLRHAAEHRRTEARDSTTRPSRRIRVLLARKGRVSRPSQLSLGLTGGAS